jgi:hypothetical protein
VERRCAVRRRAAHGTKDSVQPHPDPNNDADYLPDAISIINVEPDPIPDPVRFLDSDAVTEPVSIADN